MDDPKKTKEVRIPRWRDLKEEDEVRFAITIIGTGKYHAEDDVKKKDIAEFYDEMRSRLADLLKNNVKISRKSHIEILDLHDDIGQIQEN